MAHNSFAVTAAVATLFLAGCGVQPSASSKAVAPVSAAPRSLHGLHGSAFGGQQPLSGARIQIYQAGTSGYGSGATGLIAGTGVLTDGGGNFSITNDYTCTSGSYVYIVSTGGDPGMGTANPQSVLAAGLGLCDNLGPNTFIQLNEVTTVATMWALQAFASAPNGAPIQNETGAVDSFGLNIGAPYANSPTSGLAQAFSDINTLANIATGSAQSDLGAGVTAPASKVYTFANVLAACVNSNGASGACVTLRSLMNTYTSGAVNPYDTVQIALAMVRYPAPASGAISTVLGTIPSTAPFQPSLVSVSDFTLGVTYSGSGINAPSAIAIDKGGKVWIANTGTSSVTGITHSGTVLTGANGITTGINSPTSLAVDVNGNVWIANKGSSTVAAVDSTGATLSGSPFAGGGLSGPVSLAFDASSNLWLANGNGTVSEFSSSGTPTTTTAFQLPGVSAPSAIAIDPY